MPLRRVYDKARNAVTSSVQDGYRDRLARWSDIQEYLPFLYGQARGRKNPVILELGARRANSTLAFLAATNGSGQVWSSDIDDILKYKDGIGPWRKTPNWTFVCGDDMSAEVQEILPAEVDILFIDTSHEYEQTARELTLALTLKPARIVMHDYVMEPVARAAGEFCARENWALIDNELPFGLATLEPRAVVIDGTVEMFAIEGAGTLELR